MKQEIMKRLLLLQAAKTTGYLMVSQASEY